jgi:hypothetical protein
MVNMRWVDSDCDLNPPRLASAMNSIDLSGLRVSPVSWLRAALLTLMLLGILGMHGLAAHSLPTTSHAGETSVVSMGSLQMERGGPTVMGERGSAAGEHRVGSSDPGRGEDHLDMVGICVAVLVGLALALAIAYGRRYRVWWRVSPRARMDEPRLRSRIPRPPTLAELSLLRC